MGREATDLPHYALFEAWAVSDPERLRHRSVEFISFFILAIKGAAPVSSKQISKYPSNTGTADLTDMYYAVAVISIRVIVVF